MQLEDGQAATFAKDLSEALASALEPRNGSLGRIERYLHGNHDLPYTPRGATREYRSIARKSITNWLPLISGTYSEVLFVDGFRAAKQTDNISGWDSWVANGMEARQSIAIQGALDYGHSYVRVLPGEGDLANLKPLHPTRVWTVYEDEDDAYPALALFRKGKTANGKTQIYELYDDSTVYTVLLDENGRWSQSAAAAHGMGVVPFVRFRDRLDGYHRGIIEPLITLQDRINEAVFSLLIALQYASFRQRWATGLSIPTKDELGPDGQPTGKKIPVEPFEAAVNRLWVSDNKDAKFGEFGQTDTKGHLGAYDSAVRTMAAIAQISPNVLLGNLVNLSADALAAAEATTQRKASSFETIFGQSWNLVFRLIHVATGNDPDTFDEAAAPRWRDSEARSMSQTVDALGKMVQMLQVPYEAAWAMIPGITDGDLESWRTMRASGGDGLSVIADVLTRTANPALPNAGTPAPPSPAEPAA
jgi:hypothetical protein